MPKSELSYTASFGIVINREEKRAIRLDDDDLDCILQMMIDQGWLRIIHSASKEEYSGDELVVDFTYGAGWAILLPLPARPTTNGVIDPVATGQP